MNDQEKAKAAILQLPTLYRKFDADMQEDENLSAVICGLELLRPIAAGKSVIVPIELTEEMSEAFTTAHEEFEDGDLDVESPTHEWMAMIAAAKEGE